MQHTIPNATSLPAAPEIKHAPSGLPRSWGLGLPVERTRGHRKSEPVKEIQYQGFSLRCSAHRKSAKAFLPALEIRADDGDGEVVYERLFRDAFGYAQQAVDEALKRGQAIVDGFCESAQALN